MESVRRAPRRDAAAFCHKPLAAVRFQRLQLP